MAVIDVWIQHPTLRFLRQDSFAQVLRWTGQSVPEEELPIDLTVAMMDEADVDRGLICAWYDATGPIISNDEVAGFVAAHPDRLVGVASIDLRDPVAAVRELRRAVNDLGFKALRIMPWIWGLPPNHRLYYPLYAECVELAIPFMTQVGHTGPMRSSEAGRPIPYLDDVALDFPDLTIVAGHIGYPWTIEMIALATKYPNVHIDTSAYAAHRYPRELVEYMRGHGRRKVLFGSDYPMLTAKKALMHLDSLDLDQEATELFLQGNADRLFPR